MLLDWIWRMRYVHRFRVAINMFYTLSRRFKQAIVLPNRIMQVLMRFSQVSIQENLLPFTSCIWTATHDIKCYTCPYSHIWNLTGGCRESKWRQTEKSAAKIGLCKSPFSAFFILLIRFPKADLYIFSWCKKQKKQSHWNSLGELPNVFGTFQLQER